MAAFSFRASSAWWWEQRAIDHTPPGIAAWLKCCIREELQQFSWGRIH
jgi:hypothetical protein